MSKNEVEKFVLELQSFLRKWDAEIVTGSVTDFTGKYLFHTVSFKTPTDEIIPCDFPILNADSLDKFLANMNNPKYYFGK